MNNEEKIKRLKKLQGKGVFALLEMIDEIHSKIDSVVESFKNITKPKKGEDYLTSDEMEGLKEEISPIKGIDYRDGIDGIDGKDGKNGIDGKDGRNGIDGLDGLDGINGKDGKDGENGSPDLPEDIKSKLETLKGKDRLSATAIKGFEDLEYRLNNLPNRFPIGGNNLEAFLNGSKVGSGSKLNITGSGVTASNDGSTTTYNFTGGGSSIALKTNGTTNGSQSILNLKAGTNVTLTDNGSGQITIDASGGASGIASINGDTTSAQLLTVGTPAGTDFTIDSTTTPGTTAFIFPTASGSNRGLLSSTDWTTFNNKGSGTVTAVSVATANGFAGTSSGGATPALTLTTSVTGLLKGNGTAISAASAGTDYQAPITLTTTGTSGAATFIANTLNIPQYAVAGSGVTSFNTRTGAVVLSNDDVVSTTYCGLAGGTANVITLTPNPAITAYADGQAFIFKAQFTTTTSSTININGLGALPTTMGAGSVPAGDILINNYYRGMIESGGTAIRIAGYDSASVNGDTILGQFKFTGTNPQIKLGTASGNTGGVQMYNSSNSNLITLRAGASTSTFSFTLPVDGGSNGQVLKTDGSASTSWTSDIIGNSATATNVAVGGITGLGTGVATALAVNVGSAGAFVTFNGALGTPSSGTLTNCTFPTLNQNTSGSAASLSISGQTGLLTFAGLTSTNRIKTVRDAADTILELGGSYTPTGTWTSLTMVTPVLGTPTSGNLANCTFPTLNQNTTGTANIAGGTLGAIPYQSSANNTTVLAANATASKMLLSGASAAPTWSTSTIPTSAGATALKHLKSDGTNYVLTTATISDTPSTALKWLRSDGTNWITSTSTLSDTPSTAGKLLVSDGTNWITSTPTFPNASATSRKIIVSDGTNWLASTETYAAPGSSGNVLTSDGTNWTSAPPAGGASGLIRVGGDAAEYTTTSVTAVDLATISGLSIPAGTRVRVTGKARSIASTATNFASLGIKINSTVVTEPDTSYSSLITFQGTFVADNENGIFEFEFEVGETNYPFVIQQHAVSYLSNGSADATSPGYVTHTADIPSATVTDITIRGIVGNASTTVAVKNLQVYIYANS